MPAAPSSRASSPASESDALVAAAQLHPTAFAALTWRGYAPADLHWLIGDALRDVEQGRCKRLIIACPPRHGKTQIVSIHFPAWYLGRHPDRRIIAASYGADLAEDNGRKARNLIQSSEYRAVFPGVKLAKDSTAASRWDIDGRHGGYIGTGVGGAITGRGAHVLLIDDPVKNRAEAESETVRNSVWDWYTSTAYTRLEEGGAIIVIATRWHEDDLTGRLLAAQDDGSGDDWRVVSLPAIAERGGDDALGRSPGAALWPEKYDTGDLDRIRRAIRSRDWDALYQQRPAPAEGALFKRAWFKVVGDDSVPPGLRWARYWDLAASTRTSADFTASAAVAVDWQTGSVYIRDVLRGRWEWPDTKRLIIATTQAEPGTVLAIEKALHGIAAVQELGRERLLAGVPVIGVTVDKDKLTRALPWAAKAEAGVVYLVRGPWIDEFVSEAASFPVGAHDDQIDAVSGAYHMAARYQPTNRHASRPLVIGGTGRTSAVRPDGRLRR